MKIVVPTKRRSDVKISVRGAANMKIVLLILCLVGVTTAEDCGECTTDYRPVCGRNVDGQLQTFPNICDLRKSNCLQHTSFNLTALGVCEPMNCPTDCTPGTTSVCGRDSQGQTKLFPNNCELEISNCLLKTDFVKIGEGTCDSSNQPDNSINQPDQSGSSENQPVESGLSANQPDGLLSQPDQSGISTNLPIEPGLVENQPIQPGSASSVPSQQVGSSLEPTQPGSSFVHASQPSSSSFEPSQPGSATYEPSQTGGSLVQPTQPGSASFETTQPDSSLGQPSQLGSTSYEPPQPGSSLSNPSQSGSTSFEPAQPGSATYEPSSQPGGSLVQPSQPGSSSFEPSQPDSSLVQPSQPVSASFEPTQPGSSSFELTQLGSSLGQPSQPDSTSFDPSQVGGSLGQPYQPGSSTFEPSQPGVSLGQPSQPSSTSFEPSQPGSASYEPSQSGSASYEPLQPGSSLGQPSQPGSATYQPNEPGIASYEPSQSGSASYQPSQPGNATYQPIQPGSTSYQPEQPGSASYQPGQPVMLQNKPECPPECASDYAPVCARDSGNETVSFLNRCEIERYNCLYGTGFSEISDGLCPEEAECDPGCKAEYIPVCGQNSVEMKTFPSKCTLGVYNCIQETDFVVISENACQEIIPNQPVQQTTLQPQCAPECAADYSPVCAQDSGGKALSFLNRCELRRYNCLYGTGFSEISNGLCPEETACDPGCATEYNPVCGRNSLETRTFPSRCGLDVYNCVEKSDYIVTGDGPCEGVPTYQPVQPGSALYQTAQPGISPHQGVEQGMTYQPEPPGSSPNQPGQSECPLVCTAGYVPVCGRDSVGHTQTFPNKCELERSNCLYKSGFNEIVDGVCPESPECNTVCATDNNPVCARNSAGETETFSNRCKIGVHNCLFNTDYTHISDSVCENQYPSSCTSEYNPVCGRNSAGETKTFSNKCKLQVHNWLHVTDYTQINEGVCEETCPTFCTTEYSPLCGRNTAGRTKTFSNKCKLRVHNWLHETDYVKISEGKCEINSQCTPCKREYDPVTGRDSITGQTKKFLNRCKLTLYNCLHNTNYAEVSETIS